MARKKRTQTVHVVVTPEGVIQKVILSDQAAANYALKPREGMRLARIEWSQ